jgi:hypothetical protein
MLITVAALWSTSMTAHAAKKGQQLQRKKEVKKVRGAAFVWGDGRRFSLLAGSHLEVPW